MKKRHIHQKIPITMMLTQKVDNKTAYVCLNITIIIRLNFPKNFVKDPFDL